MSSMVDLIENVDDGKEIRERHINDISYSRMKTNNCKGCAMIRKKSFKCEKCGKMLGSSQSLWTQIKTFI